MSVGPAVQQAAEVSASHPDTPGLFDPATNRFYLRDTNTAGYADHTLTFTPPNAAPARPVAGDFGAVGSDYVGIYVAAVPPEDSPLFAQSAPAPAGVVAEWYAIPANHDSGTLLLVGRWQGDSDNAVTYETETSQFTFHFYNHLSNEGVYLPPTAFGEPSAGWLPILGDWDGDGIDTIGLYDPVGSVFYLKSRNTTGYADLMFGYGQPGAGWLPIAGDWDGDGIDTIGLYDPASSTFYLRNSSTAGYADAAFGYGQPGAGWLPVMGDWRQVAAPAQLSAADLDLIAAAVARHTADTETSLLAKTGGNKVEQVLTLASPG